MACDSHFRYFLQLLSLLVIVLALPQTPDTVCDAALAYEDTTTTTLYHSSSCTEMIPSTMALVVQSTPQSRDFSKLSQFTHSRSVQHEEHYPSQTRYASVNYPYHYSSGMSNSQAPYNGKSHQMSNSHPFAYPGTSEFPTCSPTSTYPSTQASVSIPSTPICTTGVDVNKPGLFELWSYAPGVCDLDNKVVTSTVYLCAS